MIVASPLYIVGLQNFARDIWGDTVNTASRMESSGEVGQVNISEATYALVKNAVVGMDGGSPNPQPSTHQPATRPAFTFTPRGKVQAKGKGKMEMYFVRYRSEVAQA
jgi:adenylate cyclase